MAKTVSKNARRPSRTGRSNAVPPRPSLESKPLNRSLHAAKTTKQADLVEKILGPTINEKQIFTEPTVMARLQSGELDASSAYKIQPGPLNLPYVPLPAAINLSGQNVRTQHPDVTLAVGGKSYTPEPLIYYAAVLKDAPNAKGAAAFVEWLKGEEGQAIFRKYNYDPPGDASPLRA